MVRKGKFWYYPARLILFQPTDPSHLNNDQPSWRVQWWRGCEFKKRWQPDNPSSVLQKDIVDELWCDQKARRAIRVSAVCYLSSCNRRNTNFLSKLGKWTRAHEVPTDEDILLDFPSSPYTDEIDHALSPYRTLLHDILLSPMSVTRKIPSLEWHNIVSSSHFALQSIKSGIVPHTGDVSILDQARTANWFFHKIKGAKLDISRWLGCVPMAHTLTILIACRKKNQLLTSIAAANNSSNLSEEEALWVAAWNLQQNEVLAPVGVDVDLECLSNLEERIFENSFEAGVAGNQQWGLDVGPHQNHWEPYVGLPSSWIHEDREEHDSEVEVRSISSVSLILLNLIIFVA